MRHGSLFNGIGGFQLAAEWMGWVNIMSCEIDKFCTAITKQHFPNCIQHGDIKTTDFTKYKGLIDILTGGFPCQPYSTSGKRLGKADVRHLWPEMLRAVREIQPLWVVGENVRGLISWNGGLVFDEVQTDLENAGYEVLPFLLPACAVNAPHRRERIWFIAHSGSDGYRDKLGKVRQAEESTEGASYRKERNEIQREWSRSNTEGIIAPEFTADTFSGFEKHRGVYDGVGRIEQSVKKNNSTDTSSQGLPERIQREFRNIPEQTEPSQRSESSRVDSTGDWSEFPTQSPVCGRDDGIPNRVDRIKALGNAIVPQVAYKIFKAINETP